MQLPPTDTASGEREPNFSPESFHSAFEEQLLRPIGICPSGVDLTFTHDDISADFFKSESYDLDFEQETFHELKDLFLADCDEDGEMNTRIKTENDDPVFTFAA